MRTGKSSGIGRLCGAAGATQERASRPPERGSAEQGGAPRRARRTSGKAGLPPRCGLRPGKKEPPRGREGGPARRGARSRRGGGLRQGAGGPARHGRTGQRRDNPDHGSDPGKRDASGGKDGGRRTAGRAASGATRARSGRDRDAIGARAKRGGVSASRRLRRGKADASGRRRKRGGTGRLPVERRAAGWRACRMAVHASAPSGAGGHRPPNREKGRRPEPPPSMVAWKPVGLRRSRWAWAGRPSCRRPCRGRRGTARRCASA